MTNLDNNARRIASTIVLTRRGALCGLAGLGTTAILTACGGGSDEPAQDTTGSTTTGSPTSQPSEPHNPDGSDTPTSKPDEPGKPSEPSDSEALATVADVPVKGGVIVEELVIVQPEKGTIRAFNSACTHQGAAVAAPKNNVMTCPLHGSRFSSVDGSVQNGPAVIGLTEVQIAVKDGQIYRV